MGRKKKEVKLEAVKIENLQINIEGTTPLIIHKFSDKAKKQMVDKQTGKTSQKKHRDIKAEVEACKYYMSKGRIGFPCGGFKKAMVEVGPYLDGLDKKKVKGSMYVIGEENNLVPIAFEEEAVNEAIVRLSGPGRTAMVRYRPEFRKWTANLNIQYNANMITPEQIVNLVNMAGFHIGVGDWRPQRDGINGMFRVCLDG